MENISSDLGHNPNATAEELLRAREGFDPKAHIAATKDAPRVEPQRPATVFSGSTENGPNPAMIPPRRANELPKVVGSGTKAIDMVELQANLRNLGLEIVQIGETPSDPGGYALNQQARLESLEKVNASLLDRAVSAEKAAADLKAENASLTENAAAPAPDAV